MVHSTFREVRCDHGKVRCLVHSNFMDRGMVYTTFGEARVCQWRGSSCGPFQIFGIEVVLNSTFGEIQCGHWYVRGVVHPILERFGVVMGRFDVCPFQLYRSRCKIPQFGEARVGHGEACVGHGEVRFVVNSKFGDRGVVHSTFGVVRCGHW